MLAKEMERSRLTEAASAMMADWKLWAEDAQLPPPGDWWIWLLLGGRGSGKTRAGAEWVRARVESRRARRIALVGATLGDVREVMIEGASGLRALGGERPRYEPSRRRLVWDTLGAEAFAFSAEDPDSLRGPQFDTAWCDEVASWTYGVETWDTMRFALRIGRAPRTLATTTPQPGALLRKLVELSEQRPNEMIISRSRTVDNADNLAPGFVEELQAVYGGSVLGRRELEGEMVEAIEGALWTHGQLDGLRTERATEYRRIVVAVDPPAGMKGDACGIVACGQTRGGNVHVLEDASARGLSPLDWAGRAVSLARRLGASAIIAEANQGGEMVRQVLNAAGADTSPIMVELRHATLSKYHRAQPVSTWYAKGRVQHAGKFCELEDEMCTFTDDGGPSPDRLDALVWAVTELAPKQSGVSVTIL